MGEIEGIFISWLHRFMVKRLVLSIGIEILSMHERT